MSQMPPPPPSEPAPMGGQPGTAASNSKTNVILAYLLWWVTGIIFLFVGKKDLDVKWNAAQSIVDLGGLCVIASSVSIVQLPLGGLSYLLGVLYWILLLVGACHYRARHIADPG